MYNNSKKEENFINSCYYYIVMSLRKAHSTNLAALVCAGFLTIAYSGCDNSPRNRSSGGSSSSQSECYSDQNCPEEQVCENNQCINPSSPPLPPPPPSRDYSTPGKTISGFAEALKQSNLEESLEYIDPSMRNTYRTRLGSADLSEMGRILGEAQLVEENSLNPRRKSYNYLYNGTELPIIFYQEEEGWKIHGF